LRISIKDIPTRQSQGHRRRHQSNEKRLQSKHWRKFFRRKQRRRTNGTARRNRQPTGRPAHGLPQRGPTTRTRPGGTTATTKTTQNANKPSKIQAPGIKDNKNVTGKRNQRDRHQMADECKKKRDRIAKSDMQHREKQQRMMENIRAEILAEQQESTSSNTTTPTSSHTATQASSWATSPITSRETSPSPTRKISRRERVDKNLQDITARMQQTGQVLTSAGSALLKSIKPDRKYR
jgi:hypothetical protein